MTELRQNNNSRNLMCRGVGRKEWSVEGGGERYQWIRGFHRIKLQGYDTSTVRSVIFLLSLSISSFFFSPLRADRATAADDVCAVFISEAEPYTSRHSWCVRSNTVATCGAQAVQVVSRFLHCWWMTLLKGAAAGGGAFHSSYDVPVLTLVQPSVVLKSHASECFQKDVNCVFQSSIQEVLFRKWTDTKRWSDPGNAVVAPQRVM